MEMSKPFASKSDPLERCFSLLLLLGMCVGIVSVAAAAYFSLYGKHPDETAHGYSVLYFTRHLWPPPLNADELHYQPDGISRVYNGELFYYVCGWATHLVSFFIPSPFTATATAANLRWFQVLLYAVTLGGLWCATKVSPVARLFSQGAILALICLPQAAYVYTYLNSDAWGVSFVMGLALFFLAQPDFFLRLRSSLIGGALIGLLFLCKQNFWLAIPLILFPSFYFFITHFRSLAVSYSRVGGNIAIGICVTVMVLAPFKIIYPLTQGGFERYAQRFEEMREARSNADFKPSNITAAGYRWKTRGVLFSRLYNDADWRTDTAKSFYAVFGYWTARMTPRVYTTAAILLAGFILLTIGTWGTTPWLFRWMILAAPPFFALCYLASLYNSWTYDVQPQGRYLFGFLPALALLLRGGSFRISETLGRLRIGLAALALVISQFLLWKHLILNPLFWS